MHRHFEGTRDFIVAHYKTNSRTDTDYWRANAANTNLSDPLRELLGTWLSRQPLVGGLRRAVRLRLLDDVVVRAAGRRRRVSRRDRCARPPPRKPPTTRPTIDNLIARSALNFRDHRELLGDIPPKPRERTLQLFKW
jgi:hypothetical protein